MYLVHQGKEIVIAPDTQEEAAALLAVLSGTPTDEKSRELGQRAYAFFFQAVQKLAANFDAEVKGVHSFPWQPKKTTRDSIK